MNWYDIQPQFNYADADVLLLLDCCHGSQSARDKIGFELLAGCAMKRETLPPGQYSFTIILLREMDKLLLRNNEVTIAELYHHLIRSRAGLSETPIYVPSIGEGAREAICLSPIGHEQDTSDIDDIKQDLYSLWIKIQVSGPLNDDVEMLRTLTNYLRRGLPRIIVGMDVEEIIARAEGLHIIARQSDRMMDGKPLVQTMNNTSRLRIGNLWRSSHRLLLECSSFWIAGCLNKAQLVASSLRDKLTGLLQEIDARNNTLADVIAQGMTQIQELDESTLHKLEHNEIAEAAGLTESFRLQRLVRYSDNLDAPPEMNADSVRPLDKTSMTWQLDTDQELVIVEQKSYEKHDHPPKVGRAKERVRDLAKLLAVENSHSYRSLACLHWFHDDYHHKFGLVFRIPEPYGSGARTLLEFMKSRARVPLEQRFEMARCLCCALQKWHSVNWLHKGIKSNSVLILQLQSNNNWDFQNPFLTGQEYARPDTALSSARFVQDFEENVYRHPDRQGQPRETHTKYHDIYSLGVVLLEIGLWQPASEFQDFRPSVDRLTPEHMRKILITNAKDRLHHYMGSEYQGAVLKCLNGEIRPEMDNVRDALQLAENFRGQVIDSIAKGITAKLTTQE